MSLFWSVASLILFLNNVLLSHQTYRDTSTTVLYKWKSAEYEYASEKAKNDAIKKGQFTPNNVLTLDVDYHPTTNRYFVTTPQFRNGTPATLSEVVKGKVGSLKPFPNWPNNNNRCQGPFSVFRIHIDKCGLMWVPDTGRSDIMNSGNPTCQPKLLVYDLNNNDKEVLNYEFPQGVFTDRSLPINIITESYQKDCSDSIAYITDVMDHGLVVFDYAKKSSYRIDNRFFYIFPPSAVITTNGVTFDSTDGIFGLALGPSNDRNRKLYFHSFASVHECWVPVSMLKNQTLASDRATARSSFVLSPGQRTGQSTVEVMTEDGVLIYPLIPTNSLACWNSKTTFSAENQHVLVTDNENLQFISGMKLIGNKLYIMSSRFQNFNVGILNGTDVKYRVLIIEDVKRMLQNTPCHSGETGGSNYGHGSYGEESYGGSQSSTSHGGSSYGGSHHSSSASHGSSHHSSGSYGSHTSSNGGGSCYGSSCGRPQTSHTNSYKPAVSQSGVIFKPHHSRPRTYSKQSGKDYAITRFGDSDDIENEETVDDLDQNELTTSNETSTFETRSAHKARVLW